MLLVHIILIMHAIVKRSVTFLHMYVSCIYYVHYFTHYVFLDKDEYIGSYKPDHVHYILWAI